MFNLLFLHRNSNFISLAAESWYIYPYGYARAYCKAFMDKGPAAKIFAAIQGSFSSPCYA